VRPDGEESIFGVVTMLDGSTILPIDDEGNVYLAKEYKYAVGEETIEAISGGIDEGEEPIDAARRELGEEVGFDAEEVVPLGFVDPFTTVIKSRNYCFLARGLKRVGAGLDEGEVVETVKVPFDQALGWAMSGKISHGASVATILRAKTLLDKEEEKWGQ